MTEGCIPLLEKLYVEHRTHARHIETLRSGVLSAVNVLGAALLAFAIDDKVQPADARIGVLIIGLGLFGGLFAAKLHEKLRLEMKLAEATLAAWEAAIDTPVASTLRASVKATHAGDHRWMEKVKMIWLWIGLATLLSVLGIALTTAALTSP